MSSSPQWSEPPGERRGPLSTKAFVGRGYPVALCNMQQFRRIGIFSRRKPLACPPTPMKSIKVGLDGLTALDKVAKALFIEGKLTGNPNFTTPQPPVADITTARETLEMAIAAALNGGRDATFAKNTAEAELDELLVQEAGYVVSIAGGDEAMILSAGFDVRKPARPIGPLPKVANLHADLTDQIAEILADWDVTRGAHEYEVQRNSGDPAVEAGWQMIAFTTRSKFLDTRLASGSTHWYRVRARGTAGDGPFSDPAQAMAR